MAGPTFSVELAGKSTHIGGVRGNTGGEFGKLRVRNREQQSGGEVHGDDFRSCEKCMFCA